MQYVSQHTDALEKNPKTYDNCYPIPINIRGVEQMSKQFSSIELLQENLTSLFRPQAKRKVHFSFFIDFSKFHFT